MAKGLDTRRIKVILDEQSNGNLVRSALSTIENLLSEAEKGGKLMAGIRREAGVRRISLAESFAVPEEWEEVYRRQFVKIYAQTGLSDTYASIAEATKLAANLFDPVLRGEVKGLSWDPERFEWR